MDTNISCHIMIETPQGEDNLCFTHTGSVRWSNFDAPLRAVLGIPDGPQTEGTCPYWEHLENHEYQIVLDAALAHKQVLLKDQTRLSELTLSDVTHSVLRDRREVIVQLERIQGWIAYYELAATLVKLGHKVVCFSA